MRLAIFGRGYTSSDPLDRYVRLQSWLYIFGTFIFPLLVIIAGIMLRYFTPAMLEEALRHVQIHHRYAGVSEADLEALQEYEYREDEILGEDIAFATKQTE